MSIEDNKVIVRRSFEELFNRQNLAVMVEQETLGLMQQLAGTVQPEQSGG